MPAVQQAPPVACAGLPCQRLPASSCSPSEVIVFSTMEAPSPAKLQPG
ncbi:hypothetical protein [Sphaerotilus sulfidivorans]|nr:hypothetical protein [Sphaerotilus sulfidivorans]NZD46986.1 hypothetical protein [Sphaerotilus sulfidivorans]